MKREQDETTNEILIAGLTPYFLEKPLFWFRENLTKIKLSAKTQSWWRNRTLFLKKDQKIALSSFLRRLDELGYEKVQKNSLPGEFSRLGGTIEIFPINSGCPLRIEFFGNRIEHVAVLPKETARRTPYPPDNQRQKEPGQPCEPIEPEHQFQAIREIKNAMQTERPMDR